MQAVTMVAKTRFSYAKRQLEAGDEFEATEVDAKVFEQVLLAIRKEDTAAKGRYQRRDMRAKH